MKAAKDCGRDVGPFVASVPAFSLLGGLLLLGLPQEGRGEGFAHDRAVGRAKRRKAR